MARAKGTDRAEARRRYRAIVKAQEEAEAGSESPAAASSTAAARRNRGPGAQGLRPLQQPAGQRLGFFGAAKAAYRPVHYRDDLRLIIPLVTRTHAVWPVLVLTIVLVPMSLSRPDVGGDPVLAITMFFLSPVPMLPAMMAGFLAPRATWLAGLIDSFITGVGILVFAVLANGHYGFAIVQPDRILGDFVQVMSAALPFGMLMAAATGWYKRFLALMSGPSRSRSRK